MNRGYSMKIKTNMTMIIALVIMLIVSGCNTTTEQQTQNAESLGCTNDICNINNASTSAEAEVQKIEVIHFHGTNQCYSCKTVGAYAEETINTYYPNEIKSGRIVFSSINYDLIDNKVVAMKYGVSGSSLWIGVYDSNGFHPEQNTNVWYKINDKQGYMTYLKGIIDKRLVRDFS